LFGKWSKVRYTPALFKMINEILDNCLDENIRTSGKFANRIDVSITDASVTVTDNGRGIPQETIVTPEDDKILRPVAAWTRVNAGTSFEENRTTIGANGLGSAAVNFLSSSFMGPLGRMELPSRHLFRRCESDQDQGNKEVWVWYIRHVHSRLFDL
jgi:DNA gyrase/topoisomerase IV subunit B